MTLRYGRGMGGARVVDSAPMNTPTNTTVIAAMSLQGVIAPATWQGGTTKDRFLTYLDEVLLPLMHPGDRLVLDNLSAHHANVVKELLEKHEIIALYLPPYSPDFNPIEMCWSKMKHALRKLRIRDVELLGPEVVRVLTEQVTEHDCAAWFAADGYTLPAAA